MLSLHFIKGVEHGEPLLLIGADLLQGGRPLHSWNWQSIGARSVDVGKVHGFMTFVKGGEGGEEEEVKLLNAPPAFLRGNKE